MMSVLSGYQNSRKTSQEKKKAIDQYLLIIDAKILSKIMANQIWHYFKKGLYTTNKCDLSQECKVDLTFESQLL